MHAIARWLRGLQRSRRGSIVVEVAVTTPVLLLLLMGGVDFARFALVNQKLDRVAGTTGDLLARSNDITPDLLADYFVAAQQLAAPFDMAGRGTVIVSSIVADQNGADILWQRTGAGSLSAASQIGVEGDAPILPEYFEVEEGESVIVAEVYYEFESFLLADVVPSTRLYYRSFYRPRTVDVLSMVDPNA